MTTIVPTESIVSKILFFRGEKALLDRDLADLYGIGTKVLKQAVKRNIKRFPDDFMFELTKEENQSLRSQNVTLKRRQHREELYHLLEVRSKLDAFERIQGQSVDFHSKRVLRLLCHDGSRCLSFCSLPMTIPGDRPSCPAKFIISSG